MFKKITIYLKTLLILGLIIFAINFASGYFGERSAVYIKQKATLAASSLIEKALREGVISSIDIKDLITVIPIDDEQNTLYINTKQVNDIMAKVNNTIKNNIYGEEHDELQELEIPLGIIISDTLFVNSGPMLKVEMYPVGSFSSDIVTNIEEYGINNTLLTISIKIDIMFDTIIPLNKQTINVNCEVPILVQIIQGEVPTYYYQNKDSQYLPMPVN